MDDNGEGPATRIVVLRGWQRSARNVRVEWQLSARRRGVIACESCGSLLWQWQRRSKWPAQVRVGSGSRRRLPTPSLRRDG